MRRLLLRSLVAGGGLLAAGTLGKVLIDLSYTGEGNEPEPLAGTKIEGGEIVDDLTLAQMYAEAIETNRPPKLDPTLVRSTVYSALSFSSVDHQTAARRSANISLSSTSETSGCPQVAVACAYDTSDGLGIELTPRMIENFRTHTASWPALFATLSHDPYHMAVRIVDD